MFHAVILLLARSSVASAGFFFVSQFRFFFGNKKGGLEISKYILHLRGLFWGGFFFFLDCARVKSHTFVGPFSAVGKRFKKSEDSLRSSDVPKARLMWADLYFIPQNT